MLTLVEELPLLLKFNVNPLTLNLLTTTIVAPPSNVNKWQMGFNSAFKGLKPDLNHICHLLELLGAHHILHVSRIRVKILKICTPSDTTIFIFYYFKCWLLVSA